MKLGKVVVVGGSGMVGRELLQVMKNHGFEPDELIIIGSRTVGQTEKTPYGGLVVTELNEWAFGGAQFVFFAAGSEISKEWIPQIRNQGFRIIDLSSAFRREVEVPLVIPSINGDAIGDSDLIACPNCTTAIALMVLAPIHEAFGIKRVDLVSYQSASGAGKDALDDLESQVHAWAANGFPVVAGCSTGSIPHPLAGNLIPRIDNLDPAWVGFTREEMKAWWEANKILFKRGGILGPDVPVFSTCVRVPVQRCHSEVLTIRTAEDAPLTTVLDVLGQAFGVVVLDDPARDVYPTPLLMQGKEEVGVGRIRHLADSKELVLWVCGDQLLRGAALTAVEVVEYILSH